MDYEDRIHCLKSPNMEIVSFLTSQKLQMLEAVKKLKPKSIKGVGGKDWTRCKNVYLDSKEPERIGLIKLKSYGKAKKQN